MGEEKGVASSALLRLSTGVTTVSFKQPNFFFTSFLSACTFYIAIAFVGKEKETFNIDPVVATVVKVT